MGLLTLPRVQLTPSQAEAWQTTCSAFMWHCPAFSHIFYNILNRSGSEYHAVFTDNPIIPVAATDGAAIAFNVNTYFKYNLHNRVFIFCHEVLHCVLDHNRTARKYQINKEIVYEDGTRLPYDHDIMGLANDFVINDILVNAKHGKMPDDAFWDRQIGTWEEACVDVYRKLYGQCGGKGNKPGKGGEGGRFPQDGDQPQPDNNLPGINGKSFDVLLAPGTIDNKDETQASMDRNDAEWQVTIETANQIARLRGDMPASLKHVFGEELAPHVPWRDHIQTLIARRTGSDGYNWRRPDRRLIIRDIYAPGRTGHGAKQVVVACDTSGSIGDKEIDMFFAELAGIFDEVKPEELIIMWADASVHRVDYCDEPSDLNVLREKGAPGRGGTSFIPVFQEIDKLGIQPDALVYLTDGYGTFPSLAPSFPVIWGSIALGEKGYPFGDVVMVPKQA